MIPKSVWFPRLMRGAGLHYGVFITLGLLGLAIFVLYRTVTGYEIRMTGFNARFAEYGGVNVKRLCSRTMFASGAIAGMVGAIEILGVHHRFIDGALTRPLYAWTGLMAALLSNANPVGVLAAGIFFSAVQTGAFGMERGAKVPRELLRVLQALIILLVAARQRFRHQQSDSLS